MSLLALLAFVRKWKYECLLAILLGIVGYACWHLKTELDEAKAARIQLAAVQAKADEEARQAKEVDQENKTAIAQLQKEKAVTDKAVLARDVAVKTVTKERVVHDEKIRVVYQKPEVKKWADEPVPGDVVVVLRDAAAQAGADAETADNRPSGKGDAAGGADATDASTEVPGVVQ